MALLSQARILISHGQNRDAVAVLEKATNADPKSAPAVYYLGVAQRSLGLADSAKASFSRALELRPQMLEASAALAALEARTGDLKEAQKHAYAALAPNPESAPAYVAEAQVSLASRDPKLRRDADPRGASARSHLVAHAVHAAEARHGPGKDAGRRWTPFPTDRLKPEEMSAFISYSRWLISP